MFPDPGQGQEQLESLQQENEALKAQMSRMSSQLMDVGIFPLREHVDVNHVLKRDKVMFSQALQAQLVGFLPPSPHRMPRVQNRGDDEENAQVGKRFAGSAHLVPFLHLSLVCIIYC